MCFFGRKRILLSAVSHGNLGCSAPLCELSRPTKAGWGVCAVNSPGQEGERGPGGCVVLKGE